MSKRKTTRRRARGSRSNEEGKAFSLVAMHNELNKVLKRLKNETGPKAEKLRKDVITLQQAAFCGQTMIPRI
jgi:hypothetical protein